jgi:prepilin-type N-terminal cleavage/methylation domain-containing protein
VKLKTSRRGGFTLLELLVVIMVLATLAGLAISRVDWARRSADSATSAAGMAQVQENLQLYRTMKGTYPDRYDSLLDSTTIATTPAKYSKVFGHVASRYTIVTVPAAPPGPPTGPIFSLQHAGIANVVDHDPAVTFPGDSGTVLRALDFSAPTVVTTIAANSAIERSIYPDGRPVAPADEVTLIALGIGPSNTIVGATMANTPLCSAIDPATSYSRYIAVFAAYQSGKRAELKAVIDSTGQVSSAQLKNYYENAPD